jgi:hypothetical protein
MLTNEGGIAKLILSALLFPTLFQRAFLEFAWGAQDQVWLMSLKRAFLVLPSLAIILACWLTTACILTALVRQNRQDFVRELFVTWWDLGKAVFSFWAGIFIFAFNFFLTILSVIKITALGIWSLIQEIVIMPFRLLAHLSRNVVRSPIPWIAIVLTLFWCLIEAVIFTYVTSTLVVDTFSNITGENLSEGVIQIPLFIFLLFIVLGSYAVLSTFVDSVKEKSVHSMLGIGVIEVIVLMVEVMFLYREFVDSLVPWFAQYSENFNLGIVGTLAISSFVWFGIRSLSWFLFAAHGTPLIMSVIQGKGIKIERTRQDQPKLRFAAVSSDFMVNIKKESAWIEKRGHELLAMFILPPLQVVAAAINFCTLFVSTNHLFELPIKNIEAISKPKFFVQKMSR